MVKLPEQMNDAIVIMNRQVAIAPFTAVKNTTIERFRGVAHVHGVESCKVALTMALPIILKIRFERFQWSIVKPTCDIGMEVHYLPLSLPKVLKCSVSYLEFMNWISSPIFSLKASSCFGYLFPKIKKVKFPSGPRPTALINCSSSKNF